MRRLDPHVASRVLMQRLTDSGLPAYTYTRDGQPHVHAGPKEIHDAGMDITVVPAPGGCAYISEWGNDIGHTRQLGNVVNYILWLFGRTPRTRR